MTILLLVTSALALALILAAVVGPGILFVAAALAVASSAPALAQTATAVGTFAPWLTSFFDQGAAWLIGLALSGLGVLSVSVFKVALPAVLEARLRQTALTGAHLVILRLEAEAAAAWTPDRRRVAVDKVVDWVMDRMPGAVAHLKLSREVVSGIALKMLNQALSGQGASATSLPLAGAPLAVAGAVFGGIASAAQPPAAACPSCGATDPERMSRGCTAEACPRVPPADPVSAAVSSALAVPGMLLGAAAAAVGG